MNNSPRRLFATLALGAALVGSTAAAPALAGDPAPSQGSISIVAAHNTDTTTVPVPDAVFTISRIADCDPSTPAGAAKFRQFQASLDTMHPQLETTYRPAATDATGRTSIASLPLGAYLVHEEGLAENGQVVDDPDSLGDFLLALPSADTDGNPMYDVTVMPKTRVPDSLPLLPNEPSVPTPAPTVTVPVKVPVTVPVTVPGNPGATTPVTTPQQPGSVPQAAGRPNTTRINSGDGADFGGAAQWATIVFGASLVVVVFLATRRRRDEESTGEAA